MTLHEAIQRVLEQEKRLLTASEIAEILNARKWYSKKDGSIIKSSQISVRVSNYPNLFIKSGSHIHLNGRELKPILKKSVAPVKQKVAKAKSIATASTLEVTEIDKKLMLEKWFIPVSQASHQLPDSPGLYAIRIAKPGNLKASLRKELGNRGHNIMYIGIASQSLKKRLGQELWAKGHGTFF